MQYDPDCVGDYKYPVSLEFSLPTKPKGLSINSDQNMASLVLDSVRVRAIRADTNKLLMDFALKDFAVNASFYLDDMWNPQFKYNVRFKDAQIVNKGIMLKQKREIW